MYIITIHDKDCNKQVYKMNENNYLIELIAKEHQRRNNEIKIGFTMNSSRNIFLLASRYFIIYMKLN